MARKRTAIVLSILVILTSGAVALIQTPLSFGLRSLDLIEKRALMSGNVNWNEQRMKLIKNATKLKSDQDVLPYLGAALLELNDNHSFYISADGKPNLYQIAVFYKVKLDSSAVVLRLDKDFPTGLKIGDKILESGGNSGLSLTLQRAGKRLQIELPDLPYNRSGEFSVDKENGVAYLKVPDQIAGQKEDYYRSGISVIESHEKSCAWVIDLRGNHGGDVYQLIAALSPLLPNGPLLTLEEKRGQPMVISIDDQGISLNDYRVIDFKQKRYHSSSPNTVLIVDRNTESAAEMIALIFKKLNYKVYGEPTFGAVGYQTTLRLSKEITLQLATGGALSEAGQIQETAVIPDEKGTSFEGILKKLNSEKSCRK